MRCVCHLIIKRSLLLPLNPRGGRDCYLSEVTLLFGVLNMCILKIILKIKYTGKQKCVYEIKRTFSVIFSFNENAIL